MSTTGEPLDLVLRLSVALSADDVRALTAWHDAEIAAERERWQKWACRKEWDGVNDPPCHPSDKDWRPCAMCSGPNAVNQVDTEARKDERDGND